MSPQQLSLGVSLNDDATFENFYAPTGTANAQILSALQAQIEKANEPFIFLWGAPGCGLTHLLQGACHYAQTLGKSFQYFPLRELAGYAPDELFNGLEVLDLVVLDALDEVIDRPDWEFALFNLFNRLRDAGKLLLVAAVHGPQELPVNLPDLKSRLHWGAVFHVHTLDDEQKQAALQFRARARGLELNDEVAAFIIQRSPRDMNELFWLLNRLDHASLAEQRKLTIPFVKKILGL
ncbi:MAG: DnaA regulatory inactivator Hda [Gammaproteobacteria bacterium]|nr:MAG: DnaA regulatory inactivator Hda [Gammaproteobacteria bacterium]